jgi:hypothetical protein
VDCTDDIAARQLRQIAQERALHLTDGDAEDRDVGPQRR